MNLAIETYDDQPAFVPERELDAALAEAHAATRQRDELAAENARLKIATNDLRGPDAHSRRAAILRDALARKDVEILRLKDQVHHRERVVAEARDAVSAMRRDGSNPDELARLRADQAATEQARDALAVERDALAHRLAEIEPTLEAYVALVKREAVTTAQLAATEQQVEEALSRLDSLREAQAIALRASDDDHTEEMNAVRGALREAEARCASLASELASEREDRKQEMTAARDELTNAIAAAQTLFACELTMITQARDRAEAAAKAAHEAQTCTEAEIVEVRAASDRERIEAARASDERMEAALQKVHEAHGAETAELRERHAVEVAAMIDTHSQEMAELRDTIEATVHRAVESADESHAGFSSRMIEQREHHAAEIARLQDAHDREIAALRESIETTEQRAEESLNACHASHATEITVLRSSYAAEIAALEDARDRDTDALRESLESERLRAEASARRVHEGYGAELDSLRAGHAAEIAAMRDAHDRESSVLRESIESAEWRAESLSKTSDASFGAELAAMRARHAAELATVRESLEAERLRAEVSARRSREVQAAELNALRKSHVAEITSVKDAHDRETTMLRRSAERTVSMAEGADSRVHGLARALEEANTRVRTLSEDVERARVAIAEKTEESAVRLGAMERALVETAACRDRYVHKLASAMEQVKAAQRESSRAAEGVAAQARSLTTLVGRLSARWVMDGAKVSAMHAGRTTLEAGDVDEALSWVAEEVPDSVADELWAAREALVAQCIGTAS